MEKQDNIHAGHRERMRERFMENGLTGFHDHEVLEMLLYYILRTGDTNPLAHEIMKEFGSLHNVLLADFDALCRVKGVKNNIAFFLRFMGEFHNYVEQSRVRDISLQTVENRCLYFRSKLTGCTDENMLVACLDDNYKVLRCATVAKGAPGSVTADIQTIVRLILSVHCNTVILAHNHPQGMALSSMEDIDSTKRIEKILRSIGIDLVDHIIIGKDGACSMLKTGSYMPDVN